MLILKSSENSKKTRGEYLKKKKSPKRNEVSKKTSKGATEKKAQVC